jgi:1-acyl-sn-glycerol-3-phosphate acyltransferase
MLSRLRALLLLGLWFSEIAVVAPFIITLARITGNENIIYKPVRFFVKLGLAMVGVSVKVEGLERLNPADTYVFTPNHQSLIEVPILVAYLGRNPAYLAKKEVFKYPIFGYGIGLIGVVPVDRSNSQAAIESARMATQKLQQGKSYVVYPEGTRSKDGRLLPFKKGAFVMAMEAGVPVVPVTISGSAAIMPKGKLRVLRGTVKLTIHQPISTKGFSRENISQIMQAARASVVSALSPEERP